MGGLLGERFGGVGGDWQWNGMSFEEEGETEIDDQYRYQPDHEFREKEERFPESIKILTGNIKCQGIDGYLCDLL